MAAGIAPDASRGRFSFRTITNSPQEKGVDLDEEIAVILSHRLDFKKFVLVDEGNLGISRADRQLVRN